MHIHLSSSMVSFAKELFYCVSVDVYLYIVLCVNALLFSRNYLMKNYTSRIFASHNNRSKLNAHDSKLSIHLIVIFPSARVSNKKNSSIECAFSIFWLASLTLHRISSSRYCFSISIGWRWKLLRSFASSIKIDDNKFHIYVEITSPLRRLYIVNVSCISSSSSTTTWRIFLRSLGSFRVQKILSCRVAF